MKRASLCALLVAGMVAPAHAEIVHVAVASNFTAVAEDLAPLFMAATVLYEVYLAKFATIGATYGSFATLIIIVLWIYFASSLLLFVCHLVKAVQKRMLHGPRWPKDGKLIPM